MAKRDWNRTLRTCWCGAVFQPKTHNQAHCCDGHRAIWHTARRSVFGRALIESDPAAALAWYSHLMS